MIVRRVLRMCILPLLITMVVLHGQKLLVSAEQSPADDKSGRRAAGSHDEAERILRRVARIMERVEQEPALLASILKLMERDLTR